jgi:hypothetical protein
MQATFINVQFLVLLIVAYRSIVNFYYDFNRAAVRNKLEERNKYKASTDVRQRTVSKLQPIIIFFYALLVDNTVYNKVLLYCYTASLYCVDSSQQTTRLLLNFFVPYLVKRCFL